MDRTCKWCGNVFYAEPNQVKDTARNSATYCSRACKGADMRGKPSRSAKPDEVTMHAAGYRMVYAPDHPRAHNGRIFEHILIAEAMYCRRLEPGEFVHHIDGDKTNNDELNLILVDNSTHAKITAASRDYSAKQVVLNCKECGKEFRVKRSRAITTDPRSLKKYCSLECRHKGWSKQVLAKRKEKLGW